MNEPDPRRWIALIVCCSALFMTLLDVSITNVALPSIGDSLGAGPSALQWVVSGYTLSFGLVPVLAGRLGDDHGRRRMFQIGVASFALTSVLAGLAPTAGLLVAARVLQGLAGGLINPQVSGLVQQLFSGAERGRAFGVLGATVGTGTALGPLVGGALIALGGPDLGWRLVFFVNVPVGVAVLLLARRYLPDAPPTGRHRLDVTGALVLGAATLCLLLAAVQYDVLGARSLALAVPALVLLPLFWRREERLTREGLDPLVDLRLFRTPSYTSGAVLALLFFPAMAGMPLVLALYYQRGLGYTALESALGVTAYAVGSGVAAPVAGRLVARVGRSLVVAAALAYGLGAVALALVVRHGATEHTTLALTLPLLVMGMAQGCVVTPNQALSLAEVDPVAGSSAGGVLQTAQRIGLAVGQAVLGAAFFAALPATGADRTSYAAGVTWAVTAGLVFVVAAVGVGVLDLRRARARSVRPTS